MPWNLYKSKKIRDTFGKVTVGDFNLLKARYMDLEENLFFPDTPGIIVPFYMYPWDHPNDVWDDYRLSRLIELKRIYPDVPTIVVINPGDGPGTVYDDVWRIAIRLMRASGIKVAGYIPTNYTQRDWHEVMNDILQYIEWYPEIEGIFFDEMANGYNTSVPGTPAEKAEYYRSLTRECKKLGLFTIGNPGATTTQEFVDPPVTDIIIIYESSGYPTNVEDLFFGGGWEDSLRHFSYRHYGALIYDANGFGKKQIEKMMKYLRWFYVTPDGGDNPWDTLSPYLHALFRLFSRFKPEIEEVIYVRKSGSMLNDGLSYDRATTLSGFLTSYAEGVKYIVYVEYNQTYEFDGYGFIQTELSEVNDNYYNFVLNNLYARLYAYNPNSQMIERSEYPTIEFNNTPDNKYTEIILKNSKVHTIKIHLTNNKDYGGVFQLNNSDLAIWNSDVHLNEDESLVVSVSGANTFTIGNSSVYFQNNSHIVSAFSHPIGVLFVNTYGYGSGTKCAIEGHAAFYIPPNNCSDEDEVYWDF